MLGHYPLSEEPLGFVLLVEEASLLNSKILSWSLEKRDASWSLGSRKTGWIVPSR